MSPVSTTTSPQTDASARSATTALLLGDASAGHGSLAPEVSRRTPLLLDDGATAHGSLAPADQRRARSPRRPAVRPPLLEDALAAHVAGLGHNRLKHRRLQAVIDRLGLAGRPPLTLADSGRVAGLSGERVRQLESRLRKQQETNGPVSLPQLDAAIDAVAKAVPLPASQVPRLLLEARLTVGAFCAESLRCAAELFGRELPFVFSGAGRTTVLLPRLASAAVAHAPAIEARARRQAERCGASTLERLERELVEGDGVEVTRRQLRVVLETCRSLECLQDGWFTFRDARSSGPFVRASMRMLAVTPSLSVESLHDGLRRHNSFRRLPPPPPVSVLTRIYACHPCFRVEGTDVSAVDPIDPAVVGPLNQRMVEILRASPGGVLARAHLLDACHGAGLNLTSVNLYTTYSECLERVGPGLFAPRGTVVGPEDHTAARRRPTRSDEGPVHGWTPEGQPWLSWRVTPSVWANGVVHVPAELRPSLEGRHFPCLDADGTQMTTLGVDTHGNSWGWTGFLRRAGAELGDTVRAVFDPGAETAVLEVIDRGAATPDS
ncbi:MAG TPA: hypothetical protein VHM89_13100 [Acidimicrobiales bacterium]|nr:hypothetical protein [Acidimicrobiales bacterium]